MIWYPVGNRFQLFDIEKDPHELNELSASPEYKSVLEELKSTMIGELWGSDLGKWIDNGKLAGEPEVEFVKKPNRTLLGQRGWR